MIKHIITKLVFFVSRIIAALLATLLLPCDIVKLLKYRIADNNSAFRRIHKNPDPKSIIEFELQKTIIAIVIASIVMLVLHLFHFNSQVILWIGAVCYLVIRGLLPPFGYA